MPRSTTSSEAPNREARSPIQIRPAALDDLDALLEIYLSSARHHVDLDPQQYRVPDANAAAARLRAIIEDEGQMSGYLAAVVDDRVVGSVSIALLPPPSGGSMMAPVPSAEVGIAVLDGCSRRGRG